MFISNNQVFSLMPFFLAVTTLILKCSLWNPEETGKINFGFLLLKGHIGMHVHT